MKGKSIIFSILEVCIFLIASCNPRIVNFINPSVDFFRYKTYVITNFKVSESDLSREGTQILNDIEDQIQHQMERRSYEPNSKSPDLVVRYDLISNQQIEANQSTYASSFYTRTNVRMVLESALLIEITDFNTKKIIWQASVDLNKYTKKNKQEEILEEAISKLYDTYLYRAESNSSDESLISDK